MITREEALELLDKQLANPKKKRHSQAVSAIMKGLAKRLDRNESEWELVGLLHDLDYDFIDGDMRKHGLVAAEMLKEKLSEEGLQAIRAHDYRSGVKPKDTLDKALIAADCVWMLIARVAFVASGRKVGSIKPYALRNSFRSRSFPPFLRSGILMCRDIGLTLDEFFETSLKSLPSDLAVTEEDI